MNADAIAVYQHALTLQPNEFTIYRTLGELNRRLENFDRAAEYYGQAVNIKDDDSQLRYFLAATLDKQGDYAGAIVHMERALELSPDTPDFYWLLGDLYVKAKRYGDAVAIVQEELKIRPNSAAAYCVWGKALEKQGRYEEAITKFQRAVSCADPAWTTYANKEIERQNLLIERQKALEEQRELEGE
jgi:tetratricopeptide (TPR) repeat protein